MSQRRPSLIFRFAGLATMAMLALLTITYAWIAPRPTRGDAQEGPSIGNADDPRWADARAWIADREGQQLVICEWPTDLPRGGRIFVGEDDAPAFWDDGKLVQAVPEGSRGGLVRAADGAARAWVAYAGGRCEVIPPVSVRVDGRVVDASRTPEAGVAIDGCGQEAITAEDGSFRLSLGRDALAAAEADEAGKPRCSIGRAEGAQTRTPIDLARGGVQPIMVQ